MALNPIGNAGSPAKKGSDVVHGLGRRPSLGGMPLEILERGAVDHSIHGVRHRPPQIGQVSAGISGRATRRAPGRAEAGAAFHGTEESTHGDLVRRLGQAVSARRAAPRVEKPRSLEAEQDLLEVPLGYALSPRDVLDGLQRLSVVGEGQVEHRLDGVLALGGYRHARPRSRIRAASLAKYVMMMSAPARRMPVIASIMAASSSSQPSWPAARSIAYSPDTEYAATGRPNSLFTLAMMSRYGRAGLTLTMSAPSSTSRAA